MKSFWFLLLLIPGIFLQDSGEVEVYRVEKDDRLEIFARNTYIYPVTLELNLQIKNLRPNKSLPFTTVISPQNNSKIMELAFTDKAKGWEYRSSYRYYMGNIFARHDDSFAYRLPFPNGDSYRVSQGFGGDFSHGGELQHALDFDMPDKTPVYAARGGIVVMMEEKNTEGGPSEDMMEFANYITVMHSDGTFADYTHLRHNGVNVKLGQQVRMGQLIGYSGATGYATGPHLHFVVKKAKRGGGFISIPVNFTTTQGIIQLEEGETYFGY
jgi:murein DD-endopeptidase MepM/ murein hydrolase activator NlpD